MANVKPTPMWMGKHQLVDASHEAELETRAAALQFRSGKSKDEAEAQAYKDYLGDQALDAAAHHLVLLRGAHAAQQHPAAQAHGEAYSHAMTSAGLDPLQPPPKAVLDRAQALRDGLYQFRAHPADGLWTPTEEHPETADQEIREQLDRLRQLTGQIAATDTKSP